MRRFWIYLGLTPNGAYDIALFTFAALKKKKQQTVFLLFSWTSPKSSVSFPCTLCQKGMVHPGQPIPASERRGPLRQQCVVRLIDRPGPPVVLVKRLLHGEGEAQCLGRALVGTHETVADGRGAGPRSAEPGSSGGGGWGRYGDGALQTAGFHGEPFAMTDLVYIKKGFAQ